MDLIGNVRNLLFLTACSAMLPTTLVADEHGGNWISIPRSLITIVVGDDGGRITGPEWEYKFAANTKTLDFEIAPGRRVVLHRNGDGWVGEYFHPRIRPGDHPHETHSMLFVRAKAASR